MSAPRISSPGRRVTRIYMPVIKVNDQQFSLRPGPNRLGAGADADVSVAENASLGVAAIVEVEEDFAAVIRRTRDSVPVRVNGVPLVDPTPLLHGDKVEIAGAEILFADDNKLGATQLVSVGEIAAAKRAGPLRRVAPHGGRLISLVDGKEYLIPDRGLTLGREAGCDVVVANDEVSREHAEIRVVAGGYEVRDTSTNGVFVNGARIDGVHALSRAEVIRIGSEEFRFYADVVARSPVTSSKAPDESKPETGVGEQSTPGRISQPVAGLAPDVLPVVSSDANDTRPVLALLDVESEGPAKGTQYQIRAHLVQLGRGAHNDIAFADESVSDTHAKLQRRDDGWYVMDLGSTNGTHVSGHRLTAERRLDGAAIVRLGAVKLIFRPRDRGVVPNPEVRPVASLDRAKSSDVKPSVEPHATTAPPVARSGRRGLPVWVWAVVVLAVGAATAFFLLNR